MKRLLSTLMTFVLALTAFAQDEPNALRYYLKDGTTYEVLLSKIKQINKLNDACFVNEFNDNTEKVILFSELDSMVFVHVDIEPSDANVNRNTEPGTWRLEIPHLNAYGSNNLFIEKSTADYGVTYALEWDCDKKSQRWTCYQFHNGIPDNGVGRNNDWQDDYDIPYAYRTHTNDYTGSGYSRGHMCMSNDRQASEEQNKQTFYMSNAHPQHQNHNGGLWLTLENIVNKWGNNSSFRDTLYVVKAGTIDNDQILGTTNSSKTSAHLLIPKYFYMAILCVKNGEYKAIGFWTEHTSESITKAKGRDYAVSIRELEERTGIDFFCNLPDEIEEKVETNYNLSDWGL